MTKMRAIEMHGYGSADVLKLGTVDRPVPNDDQVLIKVVATSVNRPDLVQREGNYPPPKGESEIIGLEIAGTIVELGQNVTGYDIGDRVAALIGGGGYAEFAVAYGVHLIKLPDHMTFHEGACISETYITSYLNLFRIAELNNEQRVLLHGGGGGVNTAAVQLCKVLAPNAVVFVTASSKKLDLVRELGVQYVIDYQNKDFSKEIMRLTEGSGVDVILDHIGRSYLRLNMKALATEGILIIIGVTSGARAEINLGSMMVKRQRVAGSVLRSRSVMEKAGIISDFTRAVMPFLERREIMPVIHKIMPLEAARDAHREMEDSRHFGKIVLEVGST